MDSALIIAVQVLIFCIVVTGAMALVRGLGAFVAVRRRLADQPGTAAAASLVKDDRVRNPILVWIQTAFLENDPDQSKLKSDLVQAGFENPAAPTIYVATRFSLAIALPFLFIIGGMVTQRPATGMVGVMAPLALAGIGLLAPRAFVNNRASSRRSAIEHQFPDALDLMVVCVEAGLGIEAAFLRVGQETRESHPEISRELARLNDELVAGRGRGEALRALAARLNVESVRAFVALLVQTDALGVSIAHSLRTYSAEMRETRFLKAEEKAMRIPVLMTIPLVICFMPVIVTALLLPTAIDIIRTLLPAMSIQPAR